MEKVDIILPPIPNTPLEEFIRNNPVKMKEMKTALERTQLMLSLLWAEKKLGNKEGFARLLHFDMDAEDSEREGEGWEREGEGWGDDLQGMTPPWPILQMSLDQLTTYYARLLWRLLDRQGGEGRLWPGGSGKLAG